MNAPRPSPQQQSALATHSGRASAERAQSGSAEGRRRRQRIALAAAVFLAAAPALARPRDFGPSPSLPASVAVCFTPPVGCADRIVEAIADAKREVLVQAYEFTSPPILHALVAAHRRGVDVRVILDKVNATAHYSGANFVSDAGIRVWIDDQPAIAHSKILIIDRNLVVTGSFNLTRSAEVRNVEDTLFVSSPAVAEQFVANWQSRLTVSTAWE